jgi:hypothetical protein
MNAIDALGTRLVLRLSEYATAILHKQLYFAVGSDGSFGICSHTREGNDYVNHAQSQRCHSLAGMTSIADLLVK